MGMNFSPMYQPVSTKTIKADGDLNINPYDLLATDVKCDTVEATEFVGGVGNFSNIVTTKVISVSNSGNFYNNSGGIYLPYVFGCVYTGSVTVNPDSRAVTFYFLNVDGTMTSSSVSGSGDKVVTIPDNTVAVWTSAGGSNSWTVNMPIPLLSF